MGGAAVRILVERRRNRATYVGVVERGQAGVERDERDLARQRQGDLGSTRAQRPNEVGPCRLSPVYRRAAESLVGQQMHAGHLATSGDPRPWVKGGEIASLQRYARALLGWGIDGIDGTEWYYPTRLYVDSLAIGDGNSNPAQEVLNVKATHGDDFDVPIYAFSTAFGAGSASGLFGPGGVLGDARTLAQQSRLPKRKLTLVDRSRSYAHQDPNAAAPKNAFINHLVPFLRDIAK